MTTFDWILLALIGASTLLSLWRGMAHEVLSLASWFVAFWVAKSYAAEFEPLVPASVPTADLRWLLAFAGLMLAGWMACAVVRALVSRMVAGVGLGGLDRLLGAGFGLARGVLIATLIVLMGGLTRVPGEPFWQNSQIVAPLEMLAQKLTPWLPEAMASRIDFNKKAAPPAFPSQPFQPSLAT